MINKKNNITEERITTITTKSFKNYLNEVYNYKPLSVEEEIELCTRIENGDESARETLIKHNLRFVVTVAKQYYTHSLTLEDLINEGNIGLIIATENFDTSRGFKFITYAVYWIRNTILKFINNVENIVRVPNHKLYQISKIKEEFNKLEQKLNKKPSPQELKTFVGNDHRMSDINYFYEYTFNSNKQLEDTLSDDINGMCVIDTLENNVFPNTDVHINNSDSNIRLKSMLSILKNNNQIHIITKSFGLDGKEAQPIEIISRELGLSKERVRQIKEKSLILLRNNLKDVHIYS